MAIASKLAAALRDEIRRLQIRLEFCDDGDMCNAIAERIEELQESLDRILG